VEVVDKGVGISPENQQKLFKNIVQFDALKLQNGGGSGLGLYLSNIILQKHYGKIGVFSEDNDNCGSVFYVDIPVFSIQKYTVIESSGSFTGLNSIMEEDNDDHSLEFMKLAKVMDNYIKFEGGVNNVFVNKKFEFAVKEDEVILILISLLILISILILILTRLFLPQIQIQMKMIITFQQMIMMKKCQVP